MVLGKFGIQLFLLLSLKLVHCKLPIDECTIIKDPNPLPPVGVISANPARSLLIAQKYFDNYTVNTDFRGFQVYTGFYKGVSIFAANTGLGGPACAFLVEELIAHDVQVIIRLGTNDYNVTENDLNNVYVVKSVAGVYGLMRDYGSREDQWGTLTYSSPDLVSALLDTAQTMPNITAVPSQGYSIDGFYSFFDPENVAGNVTAVNEMISFYQSIGCNVRDMEAGSLLYVAQLRGIHAAAVLQAVIKSGHHHEDTGTLGIPLVLETLRLWSLKRLK